MIKLKYLFSILSIAAIFSGTIFPVAANIDKEMKVKQQSIGIQNKQSATDNYRRWKQEEGIWDY